MVSCFGAHDIILTGKDSRFTVSEFPQFRNGQNITLRRVIPRHHQILGDTERMNRYFIHISQKILDKRQRRKIETADWQEYAAICMEHLNPKVQRYGGFTPGKRVSGRAPKLQIGRRKSRILEILRIAMTPH